MDENHHAPSLRILQVRLQMLCQGICHGGFSLFDLQVENYEYHPIIQKKKKNSCHKIQWAYGLQLFTAVKLGCVMLCVFMSYRLNNHRIDLASLARPMASKACHPEAGCKL